MAIRSGFSFKKAWAECGCCRRELGAVSLARSRASSTRADPDGTAPLAPTLAALRTARIAIITDLLGDAEELLRAASVHVVAGGEVHLVHIIAREEIDLPRRTMLAADPEAPELQRLLIDSTRAGYDRAFADWRSEMARTWRAAGASYTEVVTDEPAAHAVRRITERPMAAVERR